MFLQVYIYYIATATLKKYTTSAKKYQRMIMRRNSCSYRKSEKQAWFPNTRITNKQKFEKVVAEIEKGN